MTTCSFVGAVGGAGTTRLTVEVGAALAAEDRDVAVLDAAYATQGLADHCPGRIDPDATACVTEGCTLEAGLVTLPLDAPGRLACLPAYAPFERLARAKTPEAAREFEALVAAAADRFDAVLVDTPPVAANQAVAAVTTTERVALVTPASRRGADTLPRAADRLRDLGVVPDCEVANAGACGDATEGTVQRTAVTVPATESTAPGEAPVYPEGGPFAAAVAAVAEAALDVSAAPPTDDGLADFVPGLSE
jgi:septum site-determining protein MinD